MELSLFDRSPVLRKLLKLKHKFAKDPKVEAYFQNRRQLYAEVGTEDVRRITVFRDQFEEAMEDINDQSGWALTGVQGFLDLGCAPGGFSTWVLKKNIESRGVGVTIGSDQNGWAMVHTGWGTSMLERYEVTEADLTDSKAWPPIMEKVQAIGNCNLVIAGAVFREQGDREGDGAPEHDTRRTALQISQLIVGLRALEEGGTMVAVMSLKACALTVTLFFLLKQSFEHVIATKGTMLHRIRSSYYLVCQGHKSDVGDLVSKLEAALERGLESARDRSWLALLSDADKTALTSDEEREFLGHMEPMWEKQTGALEAALNERRRSGSDSSRGRGRGSNRSRADRRGGSFRGAPISGD